MLASSHDSSQISVSSMHSSGPVTPPEATGGSTPSHELQTPSTPPISSSRSPGSSRKVQRIPLHIPTQPVSYEAGLPHSISPASLMPPPSSFAHQVQYYDGGFTGHRTSPSMGSPLGFPSPLGNGNGSGQGSGTASPSQFTAYATSYPTSGYFPSQPMTYSLSQQSSGSSKLIQSDTGTDAEADGEDDIDVSFAIDLDIEVDPTSAAGSASSSTSASKTAASKLKSKSLKVDDMPIKAPRPANAWILYRSDRLKDISAGRKIKGLDEVMRESGYSASSASASSGDESGMDLIRAISRDTPATSVSATEEEQVPKPAPATVPKMKKGKKGAKEPTEGLLSLGRGKTGRGLPQAHISKMISILWKRESADVRGKYEQLSEQRKQEHAAKYPDYKFQPLRHADKLRLKELKSMEKEREKEEIRVEKQRQKEMRQAVAKPSISKKHTRSRPSTAPYLYEPRQGMNRSKSSQALQQSYGQPSRTNKRGEAFDVRPVAYDHGVQPFPMSGYALPTMVGEHPSYPMSMPEHASSSDASRHQSRQSSPAPPNPQPQQFQQPQYQHQQQQQQQQQHQYQQPQQLSMPMPLPGGPGPMMQDYKPQQEMPELDPALFGQYAQPQPQLIQPQSQHQSQHQPQAQGQVQYYQDTGTEPWYADLSGMGPVYAQPVTFEPPPLPLDFEFEFDDGTGSGSTNETFDFDFGALDNEEQLIQQWVVMEETSGSVGDNAQLTIDPELAASTWANMPMDSQEQVFLDLDLSQTMAVQILPDLNMPTFEFTNSNDGYMVDPLQPSIDYGGGYLNMPFYIQQSASQSDHEYAENNTNSDNHGQGQGNGNGGPFLSVQQPASPDMNGITHHSSDSNFNVPLYEDVHSQRAVSASSNGNSNPVNLRYVSASAFPDTPLSVDPSGLGGLDRRISYANANTSRLDWADDVNDLDGEQDGSVKVEQSSPTKQNNSLVLPLSPLSPSNLAPGSGSGSASSPKIKSPVPRPGRRARSVASAFA